MISNGKKVKIHYKLVVSGEVIDSSEDREPLEYEHGAGQIIPGLERALEGLKAGDQKEVSVGPDDGYGAINPGAIVEVPKEKIKSEASIEVGSALTSKSANGGTMRGIVKKVGDDNVTVDFNHPLAGQELMFQIQVVEVA